MPEFGYDIDAQQKADNEAYNNRKSVLRVLEESVDAAELKSSELEQKQTPLSPHVDKLPQDVSIHLKNKKPQEWIVDLFGAKGACVILAGDKGSGKSSLLYRLCEAVSKGEKFLYELPTVKSKVLFWQADESELNALNKLHRMGIQSGFDMVFKEKGWDVLDIDKLTNVIKQKKYKVVCLDSITTLIGGKGVRFNDPEFCEKLYELNNLASKEKVLIIINSHLNKDDREGKELQLNDLIGSGLITAAVSDIWAIKEEPSEKSEFPDHYVLKCLGKRNCDTNILWNLQGNYEDYSWYLKSVGNNDLLPSKKREIKQELLRILPTEENAMTIDELSQKVNCNQEYARRCVTELHDEHECRRKKRSSGNGRPYYLYFGGTFPT